VALKPSTKLWLTGILSALNVAAVWVAAAAAEPFHATAHAAAGVLFGLWATRIRERALRGDVGMSSGAHTLGSTTAAQLEAHLEPLEHEVDQLRRELAEAQERLDFTERILAQERDPRRGGGEG
jgi:septal ring factor EnvC (AmiA/AmiB activator)